MSTKCRTAKTTKEMTFSEFHTWATAHIVFGIGEGVSLRDLVHTVVDQQSLNEVFGGKRPRD